MSPRYARERTRARHTTHAVKDGCLSQLDLPVRPGFLTAVRTVEANIPRITRDWLIFNPSAVAFAIALPEGLEPGTVVEWADIRDDLDGRMHTVVTALTPRSITFAHLGRGAVGALEAAKWANDLRAES